MRASLAVHDRVPVELRWAVAALAGVLSAAAIATPVAATSPNAGGIDVTLPIGFQVSGTITNAANLGVGGIDVQVCATDLSFCPVDTQTAANGTYAIRGVAAGTYIVQAIGESARNYLNTYYAGATSTTDPNLATQISLSADVSSINIKLATGFTVAGTVRDASSNPVANVEVDLNGFGGGGSAVTDAAGNYVVGGLNVGSYAIFARPALGSDFMPGTVVGGTVTEDFQYEYFDVTGNTTGKDVTLIAGNKISGHIAGLVRPATITAAGSSAGYGYSVEANGDFSIPALWPDQQVQLIVSENPANPNDGQFPVGVYDGTSTLNIDQSAAAYVDVSAGNITGLNLTAPSTPSIQGHLTGADALPVTGSVVLCGPGGCAQTTIGAAGAYAFWNLPDGSYSLYLNSSDHESGYITATGVSGNQADADPIVVAGADVTRDAVIPAGYTISGRVTGSNGAGIAASNVTASFTSGEFAGFSVTDSSGYYTIRGLRPGDFVVGVNGPVGSAFLQGPYYWALNGSTSDFASAGVVTVPATMTFITGTSPTAGATGVSKSLVATVQFSDDVLGVSGTTVWLHALGSSKAISATVTYDAVHHVASLTPKAKLHGKTAYVLEVAGVTDTGSVVLPSISVQFTTSK